MAVREFQPRAAQHNDETESELQRYLRVLWERRFIIVASLAIGAGIFAYWAVTQPRIYEATASIVVDRTPPQVLGKNVGEVVDVGPGDYYALQDYIQTQRRVLLSDSMARLVVQKLKLMGDKNFWVEGVPSDLNTAVIMFARSVTVRTVMDTQIVEVAFRHRIPAQAKRAVDGLVDTYIESNSERHDTSSVKASRWLADQADDLRKKLSDSEQGLYEFKRKNDLLSVALEDRINQVSQQIDRLTTALTDARLKRVARQAEADELAKLASGDPDSLIPNGDTDVLAPLRTDLVAEERRLSELRSRYEDEHPLVKQQMAKTLSVRAAIIREVKALLVAAQSRAEQESAIEKKIAGQLEQAKQDGLRVTRLEVEYNNLKRESDALAKQYQFVANRTKETELASKVKENNLHVLDYARLPHMSVSPKLFSGGVLAMIMSFLAGILLAFLLDAFDRSIKTQEHIERKVGLPFLGLIPHVRDAQQNDLAVAQNPSSPAAEFCRLIRTNLLFSDVNTPLHRLMVTSSVAREGKTFTTVSLGVVMAQSGSKVLLVDCDLRRPRLHKALGMQKNIGITNVLLGELSLDDAIQPTGVPNLSVLLSGPVPPNPAELVDAPRFREILEMCSARFERMLIDTPPSGPVTDPALIARYCDAVVLVMRASRTTLDQARRARRNLNDVGAPVLGAVLNDVEILPHAYGYQYGYGYGYGYGYAPKTNNSAPKSKRKAKSHLS